MVTRHDLDAWVVEALQALGGSGSIVNICKIIWERHEAELQASGALFYTWQYDMRWAANRLRRQKVMRSVEESPSGLWELAPSAMAKSAS